MSTFLSLLLAIFLGLILFWSTGTVSGLDEDAGSWSAMTGETLMIDNEDAIRMAITTPGANDAYVASATSLFHKQGDVAWQRVASAPPAGEMAFDAQNPDVLMVGDQEMCARGGGGEPLQISTDGGVTWSSAPDAPRVRPLAISSDTGLVGGAACMGFVISLDMGKTWKVVDDSLLGLEVTAFSVIEGGNHEVLVGLTGEGGTGRLYTVDLGNPSQPVVSDPLLEYYGLAATAGTVDTLYLASISGLSVSTDGGQTWQVQRDGLEAVTVEADPVTNGLPIDFPQDTYGLYAMQLTDGKASLLGAQDGVYQIGPDGVWYPLIQPGTPFTALQALPADSGVLALGQDFVWVVYPA